MRPKRVTHAVVAVVLAAATAGAVSAARKPQWLTIPGFWDGSTAPEPVGTASGRGWIGFYRSASRWELGSLRRAGGKLSFAKTTVAAQRPMFFVGSHLVYHLPDISGKPGDLRTAPLLPNGTVGTPKPVAGDPEKIPPQELDPVVIDGIQVGNRTVWLVSGARLSGGNLAKEYRWACCTSTGELSDLTRFVKQRHLSFFWQLRADSKKRLWLAWLEAPSNGVVGAIKLLELDPTTLAPRTSTAVIVPGGRTSTAFHLTCGAFCRVFMSDLLSGDLLASAPGQRAPTTIASGTRERPATLLAASDRAVAFTTRRTPNGAETPVEEIEVVRVDTRGSHPRQMALVDLPETINPRDRDHFALYGTTVATFVPGGLVYFALYRGTPNRVLAGYLRLAAG